MVPQRVICNKCRALLYEGKELKAPHEIIEPCEGKCPSCGNRLSPVPIRVVVRLVEGAERWGNRRTKPKNPVMR